MKTFRKNGSTGTCRPIHCGPERMYYLVLFVRYLFVTSELRTWFIYLAFSFVASVYIPRPVHMMYFYDYI